MPLVQPKKKTLRVRVVFEFRNGDGNFLDIRHGSFVEIVGDSSVEALNESYKQAVNNLRIRQVVYDGLQHGC